MMWRSVFKLLTELSSHKWMSKLIGRAAKSGISRRWIRMFAKTYGINLDEAEKAIEQYASLNEFFTRRLKPGLRPLDEHPDALICPVDAVITGIGRIHDGVLISVKGQDYSVDELLGQSPRSVNYRNGFFLVLYLSPTDYHRIHSPVDGRLIEKEHLPGKVYPVNEFGMRHIKKPLSRNERLISYLRHRHGEVALVKVGAMNVSSIRYVDPLPEQLKRGEELARFEFGSTVVLLTQSGTFQPIDKWMLNQKVRMGEKLGYLTNK